MCDLEQYMYDVQLDRDVMKTRMLTREELREKRSSLGGLLEELGWATKRCPSRKRGCRMRETMQ